MKQRRSWRRFKMTRHEITAKLSAMIEKKINPNNDPRIYWAKEVTFDYSTNHAVRVDYMKFVPVNNSVSGIEKGDCYCYEIKSSIEDFKSGHGLNFIGDYNYLVMPGELAATVSLKIPYHVGIYVTEGNELICAKKAKRANRARPVSEILLMMFRSANRDYRKAVKQLEGDEEMNSKPTPDITPNLVISAYHVLQQYCTGQPSNCKGCGFYEHCPECFQGIPCDWNLNEEGEINEAEKGNTD